MVRFLKRENAAEKQMTSLLLKEAKECIAKIHLQTIACNQIREMTYFSSYMCVLLVVLIYYSIVSRFLENFAFVDRQKKKTATLKNSRGAEVTTA